MNAIMMNRRHQQGLSLVELMVAITIGLFLLAGAVTIFANSKRTYTENDDSARMQESLRFATDMIAHDIRVAGNFGCAYGLAGKDAIKSSLGTANTLLNVSRGPLEAINGDSDSIIIRHSGGPRWRVTGPSSGTNIAVSNVDTMECINALTGVAATCPSPAAPGNWKASDQLLFYGGNGLKIEANKIVSVSNGGCVTTDVLKVASLNGSTGLTTATALNSIYDKGTNGPDAYVSLVTLVRYFAGPYDISGDGTIQDNEVGLFREDAYSATPVMLLPGIENLQVRYGLDSDGDGAANKFVNAPTSAEWPTVVSVRIGMIARSLTANALETDTVQRTLNGTPLKLTNGVLVDANGAAAPANDNRRRRTMEATVMLRNRFTASHFGI